ncbi:MAG: TrkA family potassium uptake protein [Desulfobacteraceae bacterium]|nr:TrkA family potassium uptake protein [Desulfobacteraceae bacterium]
MKQFLVIGLGNFGYHLASRLYDKGHDILAIDKNSDLVQQIKDQVTQAVVADATDKSVLIALGIEDISTAVVSIGSDLSHSILTVLNLQEIGIKNIIAKAINNPHVRILQKLGVQQIAFPEKDIAVSMAQKLHNPNVIEYLPFLDGYCIIELPVPKRFIGKSLAKINIINRFGVQVVALKDTAKNNQIVIPRGDLELKSTHILILFGPEKGLIKLREK